MRTQTQRRAHNDFIEDGRGCVDQQVTAASGTHDGPKIARVRFHYFDRALLAEKFPRAIRVAIAAPDRVTLAREQLSKQGAGAAHSQYEDAHRFATLSYPPRRETRASAALSGCAPGSAMRLTGPPGAQLSGLKTNMTGDGALIAAASFCGESNLRQACASCGCVNSLVNSVNSLFRPGDEGNIIPRANLFAHIAHHAQVRVWVDAQSVTPLPVGVSRGKSSQYDCFLA